MARAVFLNYRREDTCHIAGRLADRLGARLGATQVFMDVEAIEPGVDFAATITREVGSCNVLIALIGRNWLTISDPQGRRRIDNPDDYVALEIQAALEREIRVIPVLVDGAVTPSQQDLPERLKGLARRNALRLDHESFNSDITHLLDTIEQVLQTVLQKSVEPTTSDGLRATDQALGRGHPDDAAEANNLGLQLAEQGNLAGARAAYQLAIDSGHAEWAPMAALNLGLLLDAQGDVPGARGAYERVIDSGHGKWAPIAAVNLGTLLAEQGDLAGAQDAYQRAIDSDDADQRPTAAVNLGLLFAQQENIYGARGAYQLAIDSGHYDQAPRAAFNLGVLLANKDVGGARAAYQRAIDSGHAEWAPMAARNLRPVRDCARKGWLGRRAFSGQLIIVISCCDLLLHVRVVNFLRGLIPERRVEPLSIITKFDVSGNVLSGVFAGRVDGTVDPFDFHGSIERFGQGVIETYSSGPDRTSDTEEVSRSREGFAGILASAVGVEYRTIGELIVPGSHHQRVDH